MSGLVPEHREVLVLRYIADLTEHQVADVLAVQSGGRRAGRPGRSPAWNLQAVREELCMSTQELRTRQLMEDPALAHRHSAGADGRPRPERTSPAAEPAARPRRGGRGRGRLRRGVAVALRHHEPEIPEPRQGRPGRALVGRQPPFRWTVVPCRWRRWTRSSTRPQGVLWWRRRRATSSSWGQTASRQSPIGHHSWSPSDGWGGYRLLADDGSGRVAWIDKGTTGHQEVVVYDPVMGPRGRPPTRVHPVSGPCPAAGD